MSWLVIYAEKSLNVLKQVTFTCSCTLMTVYGRLAVVIFNGNERRFRSSDFKFIFICKGSWANPKYLYCLAKQIRRSCKCKKTPTIDCHLDVIFVCLFAPLRISFFHGQSYFKSVVNGTQQKAPQICWKLSILLARCLKTNLSISSSRSKSVKVRFVATCHL